MPHHDNMHFENHNNIEENYYFEIVRWAWFQNREQKILLQEIKKK